MISVHSKNEVEEMYENLEYHPIGPKGVVMGDFGSKVGVQINTSSVVRHKFGSVIIVRNHRGQMIVHFLEKGDCFQLGYPPHAMHGGWNKAKLCCTM